MTSNWTPESDKLLRILFSCLHQFYINRHSIETKSDNVNNISSMSIRECDTRVIFPNEILTARIMFPT